MTKGRLAPALCLVRNSGPLTSDTIGSFTDLLITEGTILEALGSPTRVARAHSLELSVEEAVVSGRLIAVLRVIWLMTSATFGVLVDALLLLSRYVAGLWRC